MRRIAQAVAARYANGSAEVEALAFATYRVAGVLGLTHRGLLVDLLVAAPMCRSGAPDPAVFALVDHQRANLPVLLIDGSRFDDFAGFTRVFSALLDDYTWRGGLDAFNDILHGGFGTPEGDWVLRWLDSERSRVALGYPATVKRLEEMLPRVHPTNRASVEQWLASARREEGQTLFDEIVEIIRDHSPGKGEDGIVLELA